MNFLTRIRNVVVHEFPIVLGVVISAINATTGNDWKVYAAAIAAALLRFVVSPAIAPKPVTSAAPAAPPAAPAA
jgi:hypothetical protein